jgi:UDP-N-acetylmuramoyl-tripeptide--D-alanyl-D-alanine ligase
LYTFLKENNKTAFINPEDKIQLEKSKALQTVNFKIDELKFIEVTPFVKLSYRDITIQSNLIGVYNYSNIAAAISIGTYFKVSKEEIKEAIESYVPQNNRSQIIETANNKIILDAYNANPSSMTVALENFAAIKTANKVVIMGDMFELGEESIYEHQAIVDLATSLSFDEIFLVGENFHQTVTEKHQFLSYNLLEAYIKKNPLEKQSILIKGSRGMRLERILDVIN